MLEGCPGEPTFTQVAFRAGVQQPTFTQVAFRSGVQESTFTQVAFWAKRQHPLSQANHSHTRRPVIYHVRFDE